MASGASRGQSWNSKNHQKNKNKKGGIDGINTKILIKTAEVVSIHKLKEKFNLGNYRPISLISNLAEVFEKILHIRLINFLLKCGLLSKNQYGFLKKLSTNSALEFLTKFIISIKKPIAVTFSDLSGRLQKVRVYEVFSDYQEVNMGVPPGTILGPLLFILYINDLLTSMRKGEIIYFADDTAVISNGWNWSEVEQKVVADLQLRNIFSGLVLNKLSLNIEKTFFVTFGSYINIVPENFSVQMNHKQINSR